MPGLKDWLAKASGDLKAAKILSCDTDLLDIAAYLTQQCAEKALKAYLVFCHQVIPKTHNLKFLVEQCSKRDSAFQQLLNDALTLDPYGSYSRYPDDRFSINQEEIKEAIDKATKILSFVNKKINEPKNPTQKLFEKN